MRPFALGLDGHSTGFVSTSPERFEGTDTFSDGLSNGNDYANFFIANVLHEKLQIDVVFAQRLQSIRDFMRDPLFRIFLYHPILEDLSKSSELILQRPEILTVLLYGPQDTQGLPPLLGFEGLFSFPGMKGTSIIMIKSKVCSLVRYIIDQHILDRA